MRDLSNHEKNEAAKLNKQVDKLNNDMNNLQKDKERLEGEVTQLQEKMIDLQEQVGVKDQDFFVCLVLILPFSCHFADFLLNSG